MQKYIDGSELKLNEEKYGKVVTIETVNYIAASNAINLETGEKRDSLKETVIYNITPNNIEVCVEIESLEKLYINRYAGLQVANDDEYYNKLYFVENGKLINADISKFHSRGDEAPKDETSEKETLKDGKSHSKSEARVDEGILTNENNDNLLCYTDKEVGIGDLRYLHPQFQVDFTLHQKNYILIILEK